MAVTIEIPTDIVTSSRMTPEELRLELALSLYATRRLSIGKAREFAQMPLWQFRQILAARQIPVDLEIDDLDAEVESLRQLGRL